LPRWAFLTAKGLAVGALLLVQTVLTLAVAFGPLGWRPAGGLGVALGLIVVGAVAHTALGLLIAGSLRAEATLALSNALFLVLLVVSGVSFDAQVLPDGLAAVGRALPVGALGDGLRAAFEGGSTLAAFVSLTAWAAVAIALAGRTFRWEP
jgi:ABC-2 type transport system permease protein